MKKKLLLLFITSHILVTQHSQATLAGIQLPHTMRTLLLTIQKKMAVNSIPSHVQHAIAEAQKNNIIQTDLITRSQRKNKALTWKKLEEHLAHNNTHTFLLFAFGSLIHINHSINKLYQPNLNIPAIAFGIQRIFNMTHFDPVMSPMGLPTIGYEEERLRLSSCITNDITDYTNGILLQFYLHSSAYNDLKEREQKYVLQPIKAVEYHSLFGELSFFDAYILVSPDHNVPICYKPHIVYTYTVLDGSCFIQKCGADGFLSISFEKTYLADKKTTLHAWIHSLTSS